jgi:hypothetical protein
MSLCTDIITFIYSLFEKFLKFNKIKKFRRNQSILEKYENILFNYFFKLPDINYSQNGIMKLYTFDSSINFWNFFEAMKRYRNQNIISRYNDNYKKLYQDLLEYLEFNILNKSIIRIIKENYDTMLNTLLAPVRKPIRA